MFWLPSGKELPYTVPSRRGSKIQDQHTPLQRQLIHKRSKSLHSHFESLYSVSVIDFTETLSKQAPSPSKVIVYMPVRRK